MQACNRSRRSATRLLLRSRVPLAAITALQRTGAGVARFETVLEESDLELVRAEVVWSVQIGAGTRGTVVWQTRILDGDRLIALVIQTQMVLQ